MTLMAAGKQQGDSSTLFTESGVGKFILTSVLILLYMEAQICSRSRAQVFHTDRPVNNLFNFFLLVCLAANGEENNCGPLSIL